MSKNDFFFGKICKGKNGPELSLSDVVEKIERTPVSASFFTAQLNRFLRINNGMATLSGESSCPPFWDFISNLMIDEIGFIHIYARTDLNKSVNATLACDLMLAEGVLSFVSDWCAYKDIRAGEIVSTLLVPLHLLGLQDKTYLRFDEETSEKLLEDSSLESELSAVFSLAEYPYAMDSKILQEEWTACLARATEIGKQSLMPNDAWEAYWR